MNVERDVIPEDLRRRYRNAFSDPHVLMNVLWDLHYFDSNVDTPEKMALRNFATTLLKQIGTDDLERFMEAVTKGLIEGLNTIYEPEQGDDSPLKDMLYGKFTQS